MTRAILLVGLALGLSACTSVNHLNRLPTTQPLRQAENFDRPGPLLLEASGFEFPERYGSFQRVGAHRFDTEGLDVGVGYNDRRLNCLIVATFYVYPTPRMDFVDARPGGVASIEQSWLDAEFARARAEIEHFHPAMTSVVVGSTSTPTAESELQGSSLSFRESDKASELRLFVFGHQWFLKYRFTYPESCQADARARLETVVAHLPWSGAPLGQR